MRRAEAKDVPALVALAKASGVAYRPGRGVLLVAVAPQGEVVGWLEGVLDGAYTGPGAPVAPPHGYVQTVVVDPGWRRRGVGGRLLEVFVDLVRGAGVGWVFAVPDEDAGVRARVSWLGACGFAPVDDPDEVWPVMGRCSAHTPSGGGVRV